MDVGRRVQALRAKHGLSQEALAERVGVTRQSVSKWELGQALPDVDKIVQLCELFGVTTDLLLRDFFVSDDASLTEANDPAEVVPSRQKLNFSMYLIVKDFARSISFYEKLLGMWAHVVGINRFAQFFVDNICISIMNESHLPGHDYSGSGDHKFVLNWWVCDLTLEYQRVKSLNIGNTTAIIHANADYHFFNVYDPDGNVNEITGRI